MNKRNTLIVGRFFFAGLTLVAIVSQFAVHLRHRFDPVNFFSYFTNLSNIFASIVFLFGAVYLLRRRRMTPGEEVARGASVVAMVVVGIVYAALLRNEDLGTLQPWVNIVVHVVMPLAVLADWLYEPPDSTITMRQVGYWLIYPLAYLVYTLVRGAIAGFYPYPFLNPDKAGGWGVVILYCIAIFWAFLLVSWLLISLGSAIKRRSAPQRVERFAGPAAPAS